MQQIVAAVLVLVVGRLIVAAEHPQEFQQALPAEQYRRIVSEFQAAARVSYLKPSDDNERNKAALRIASLSPRLLGLVEQHSSDPIALDALVQVVNQELYLQNNTSYPGRGKNNLEGRAIAILQRDHFASPKLDEACRRVSYGFSKECESFLRTTLKRSPHREVQGLACLRLAQFLNGRLRRLDLLVEKPAMAARFESWFGTDYVRTLKREDRAQAIKEVEAVFELAASKYANVKVPYGDTVGAKARSELHEIRHLSVGKLAPEIEGHDQDGKPFKLSDYRGKVVLLYFWSQY